MTMCRSCSLHWYYVVCVAGNAVAGVTTRPAPSDAVDRLLADKAVASARRAIQA